MSRILFVIDSLFPLAEAFALKTLVDGLASEAQPNKHQFCICVSGATNDDNRAAFKNSDVPIHFLSNDGKLKNRSGAGWIQSGLRLRKQIRSFQPDVVHAFGQPATLTAASVLMRDKTKKLISTLCSKWKPQPATAAFVDQYLVRRVNRFVAPHESLSTHISQSGIPREQVSVVANTIANNLQDHDRNRQQQRQRLIDAIGVPASSFIAVTSAELEPVTRLKDLIWATDLLSCIRDDFHFVIFGKGSQHQRLLDFADCTEAADHVHFAHHNPAADELIAGADVFWNSHLQSPLPGGILTAMNAAVPVISVYGAETSPLIKHQETGFAVNFGARDEFARWTKFLIEKPDAGQQLGRQGLQHVRQNFTAEKTVAEVASLW